MSLTSRRKFVGLMGIGAAGALIAACGTAPTPTPAPTPAKPAAEAPTATSAPKPAAEAPKPAAAAPTPTSAPAAKPAASTAKVKLKYQPREAESASGMQDLWNAFYTQWQQKHPNMEIEYLPTPAQYFEQLVSQIVAGTAPDIVEMCCWQSTYFVQQGQTLNLQDFIKRDAAEVKMEDYYKYQFDAWKDAKGDIHLLPRFTGTQVLYYNVDMFQEKGVPLLPKTWDETIDITKYAEIGQKFNVRTGLLKWGATNYGMGANWLTQYHLRGWGVNMVDPKDPNRSNLDQPKALECLENIRKWIWDQKWFAHGNEMGGQGCEALFYSGRVGMLEIGPWELVNLVKTAKFKFDFAPMPKGPAGLTTHQSVDGSFIWKGTKTPEESWTLLKAQTDQNFGRLLIKYMTKQPSRKSLLPEFAKTLREQYPVLKDANLEVFSSSLEKDIGRPEEMFNNDNTSKNEILQPAFDKVMLLNQMPVDVIAKAAKIVEKFNTKQITVEQIGRELSAIGVK